MDIYYYDRESKSRKKEQVYGEAAVKALYDTRLGRFFSQFLTGPLFSQFYGCLQASSISHKKVLPFINKYSINLDEYEFEKGMGSNQPYSSFNNFFIRKFKPGRREFVRAENLMPAFSEARYLGFESTNSAANASVKGVYIDPRRLIEHPSWSGIFEGGPALIARLCPVDYHRFHFPLDGEVLDTYRRTGPLDSVNPMALKYAPDILLKNERQVTIIKTKRFGVLGYVEVGAICVGKIVQTYEGKNVTKGQEKGYFLFGGSTVVVVGQKGAWKPSEDILNNSQHGVETYIKLGQEVANREIE